MSLDPSSGLPTPGVPSFHGAESVHAAAYQAAVHSADVQRQRGVRRHVHVCDDPQCTVAVAGPWVGRLALVVFAVIAVVALAVIGLVARELLADDGGAPSAPTCTSGGVTVDCPPFP